MTIICVLCRGLPLKVRVTSVMFEDRTGYQVFTVKLGPADVITDEAKFRSNPDIMMEQIATADGGPPLFIRWVVGGGKGLVVCVCAGPLCIHTIYEHVNMDRFVKQGVTDADMAEHLLKEWLLPRMEVCL